MGLDGVIGGVVSVVEAGDWRACGSFLGRGEEDGLGGFGGGGRGWGWWMG
jgi:hypothetical protein